MSTAARARMPWATAFMPPCAVLGWIFYAVLFRTTLGQDWMVFDTAAKAYFRGDVALLFDGQRFTDVLNATHSWLLEPLRFHPWVYPPTTLLLALPFGFLPWWTSYILFQGSSMLGLARALALWAPPGRAWLLMLGVFGCGAAAFTLGAGQNSFLSAALITSGIWCMHRRPALAGVLLGLMIFKPQLALLLPIALASAGAWRTMLVAAITVCVLLLFSLLVPGIGVWSAWLHLMLTHDPALYRWVAEGRLHGQSVFACAVLAGFSEAAGNWLQWGAIAVSVLCVTLAFRRAMSPDQQLAVLLCGAILAAPHVGNYDAILLGEAAMLILMSGGAGAGETVLVVMMWCALSFQPPFVITAAVVTPLLVLGVMGLVIMRKEKKVLLF